MRPGIREALHRLARPVEAAVDLGLLAGAAGLRRRARRTVRDRPGGPASRVLISRPDLLGDVVLFTATLESYRECFQDAEIVLLVRDVVAPLLKDCPFLNNVWSFPVARFRLDPRERLAWFRRLSQYGFQIAVHAPYSTSWDHFACLAGWTGAERRVAFRHAGPGKTRSRLAPWFTELVPSSGPWTHALKRDAEMLSHLLGREYSAGRPRMWLTDVDRNRAAALVPPGALGIVSPGAGRKIRQWSARNFASVIEEIQVETRLTWLICGSADDLPVCQDLADRLRPTGVRSQNMAGRLDLRVFAALLERAKLFLGNDSGAAHLANAAGTPCVYIMGGAFPGVHTPVGEEDRVVAVTHHMPCEGCLWKCVHEEPYCVSRVDPASVVTAARRVLREDRHG
jgi:ADP-heptose:LPS heptosyltransferase